ncbi:hypothetical protein COO60DRAFT_1483593 [Scenedesmus sp. NREL 46B-D3]|nr:hypothetical protein COO60DRAFT_1483593 [Scenedesmus sp. NREL 46B-D3]
MLCRTLAHSRHQCIAAHQETQQTHTHTQRQHGCSVCLLPHTLAHNPILEASWLHKLSSDNWLCSRQLAADSSHSTAGWWCCVQPAFAALWREPRAHHAHSSQSFTTLPRSAVIISTNILFIHNPCANAHSLPSFSRTCADPLSSGYTKCAAELLATGCMPALAMPDVQAVVASVDAAQAHPQKQQASVALVGVDAMGHWQGSQP